MRKDLKKINDGLIIYAYVHFAPRVAPHSSPRAYQGDCNMHRANLRIYPRGGVML